jgi:plasmid stability protein
MSTLTLRFESEDLLRRLRSRAAANQRSIEDEAMCCLQATLSEEDELLSSVPDDAWSAIERSVCETLHDRGTPLTDDDFARYRERARGHSDS